MLKHDWSDADIIYLSVFCLPDALVSDVADLFESCKMGTRVISLKEIPVRSFLELFATIKVKMTWGLKSVFYYRVK